MITGPPPTQEEILAAIPYPPGGISIGDLTKKFQSRLSKEAHSKFTKVVKEHGKMDGKTKLVSRKVPK